MADEYINKRETLENLKKFAPEHLTPLIEQLVEKQPTADVVEVVRCKDCVKDNRFDCPLCYIEKQTLQFINHDAEFYCGFAERRDT